MREIRGLRTDMKETSANQMTLMTMFESVARINCVSQKPFEEKHSFDLPFKTIDQFKDFDNKIKTDKECCHDFVSFLPL